MSSAADIGTQFVQAFYQTFDSNRAGLAPLYAPGAVLCYEGQMFNGRDSIMQKLGSLPFQTIVHAVTTVDALVTADGGLLVFTIGQLRADSDSVLGFTEAFYLKEVAGSLFIMSDIFRLTLHHQ